MIVTSVSTRFAKAIKQGKLSSNEVVTPPRLHIHIKTLEYA